MKTNSIVAALAASVCVIALATPAHAQQRPFDIPVGSLKEALDAYGHQSGRPIIYRSEDLRGANSKGFKGMATPERTLHAVLDGTGFIAQSGSSGAIAIVREKRAVKTGTRPSPSDHLADHDIVVTGTNIRGSDPLSPVTTARREKILEGGYSRLDEYIAQLPQNFSGNGTSRTSNQLGGVGGSQNYSFSSGINLRGLGSNATLVLLNGNRLPSTAFGSSVDISRIPLSAIDRVETVTDGASATYGADAVAGVVNIITRSDFEGFETGLRSGAIADSKQADFGAYVLGGARWSTGSALVGFDYDKANPLFARSRSFASALSDETMLLPETEIYSINASLRQELGASSDLRLDVLGSKRSYRATYENLGVPQSNFGSGNQITINGEFTSRIFDDWTASINGSYSNSDDEYNTMTRQNVQRSDINYKTYSASANVSGSLFSLPAGQARGAVGVVYRRESYSDAGRAPTANRTLANSRDIYSAYGEIFVPLVDPDMSLPLIHSFAVSASGRYDKYSDFGEAFSPKLAAKWSITKSLSLNASYGRSYRAPILSQLADDALQIGYIIDLRDPTYPGGMRRSLVRDGTGNPDLTAEKSRSIFLGASYTPSDRFSVEISYFDINFSNKIERLSAFGVTSVLVNASQYGNFINLSPTAADIDAALSYPGLLLFDLTGVPGGSNPADIRAIAQLGYVNASSVNPRGLDLSMRASAPLAKGDIYIDANASYFLSYDTRITPTASNSSGYGRVGRPSRLRSRLETGWRNGELSTFLRLNYIDSYFNQLNIGCVTNCDVAEQVTFDIGFSYSSLSRANKPGWSFSFTMNDVFDRGPPFVAGLNTGFDGANASPSGRAFSVRIAKKW